MESHGVPGEVHISAAAYACISDKAKYAITERGRVLVKGKGKMHTYLISKVGLCLASYLIRCTPTSSPRVGLCWLPAFMGCTPSSFPS